MSVLITDCKGAKTNVSLSRTKVIRSLFLFFCMHHFHSAFSGAQEYGSGMNSKNKSNNHAEHFFVDAYISNTETYVPKNAKCDGRR